MESSTGSIPAIRSTRISTSFRRKNSRNVPSAPDSLSGAIEALEADHEFLLKGDVFSKDLLDTLIEMRIKDYDDLRLRPHPLEFLKYYDV